MHLGEGLHFRFSLVFLMVIAAMGAFPMAAFADDGVLSIYVMNYADQDAIILECDGHFAMVDSGEDNDYPDGSNPLYPFRSGTVMGKGHEDEVIAYLEALGADEDNFDFYIGTHAHSDHIGSADEVIRAFEPDRVYVPSYSDDFIFDSTRLWDNLYVYDALKAAASDVGAPVITHLANGAPLLPIEGSDIASPTFTLGAATITIMNWDNHPLGSGLYQDANDYCWGVKVSVGDYSAFLAGDINNYVSDEDKLAAQLGHVDVLKLAHHGISGSNTVGFLRTLSPSVVVQTGKFSNLPAPIVDVLLDLGCQHYVCPEIANQGMTATTIYLSSVGVSVDSELDSESIMFRQQCGTHDVVAYKGSAPTCYTGEWISPTGKIYVFEDSPYGTYIGLISEDGGRWIRDSQGWRWCSKTGRYPKGEWVEIEEKTYYFDASGYMQTGWCSIEGSWYFFDASGSLCQGWLKNKGSWYYLDPAYRGAMKTGFFVVNGVRYYAKANGVCPASSWVKTADSWYLTSSSCAVRMGWAKVGGAWYLLDSKTGAMRTGWADVSGSRYYLKASGAMATGWLKLSGSWYYLSPSGALQKGWAKVGGAWYLLDSKTGAMRTGWADVSGSRYYLKASGAMATGWLKLSGSWYYLSPSGALRKGWAKIGGKWYWLDKNTGVMLANGWTPDGMYVGAEGAWVKGKTR